MTIIGQPDPELQRLNLETLAQSQIIAQKNKEISELKDRVKWLEEHWPVSTAQALDQWNRGQNNYDSLLANAGTQPDFLKTDPTTVGSNVWLRNPEVVDLSESRAVEPELVKLAEYEVVGSFEKKGLLCPF